MRTIQTMGLHDGTPWGQVQRDSPFTRRLLRNLNAHADGDTKGGGW